MQYRNLTSSIPPDEHDNVPPAVGGLTMNRPPPSIGNSSSMGTTSIRTGVSGVVVAAMSGATIG